MEKKRFEFNEVNARMLSIINRQLGEIDSADVFGRVKDKKKVTGIAGDVIEQSVFEYPANPDQEPDLIIDDIETELKTTGIRYDKEAGQYVAKEPMSITAVSIGKIQSEEFATSNFHHKTENMLIVFYQYTADRPVRPYEYRLFPIRGFLFNKFTDEETEALKEDWQKIHDFVVDCDRSVNPAEEYPRLSSALRKQLAFLDTAPKYPHPPRFRFKRDFVTVLVQKALGKELENLPGAYRSLNDLDLKCRQLREQFGGQIMRDISGSLGYSLDGKTTKNFSEQIIIRMFGGKALKLNKIDLFQRFSMVAKTFKLSPKGGRTEDTKLFRIDFEELMDPEVSFDESDFKAYFTEHQFLFCVTQETSDEDKLPSSRFLGFKRIIFDDETIDTAVRNTFEALRKMILEDKLEETAVINHQTGLARMNKVGTLMTSVNFPKSSDSMFFLRGSGTDSTHKTLIINGIRMYPQHLWVKGIKVVKMLDEADLI